MHRCLSILMAAREFSYVYYDNDYYGISARADPIIDEVTERTVLSFIRPRLYNGQLQAAMLSAVQEPDVSRHTGGPRKLRYRDVPRVSAFREMIYFSPPRCRDRSASIWSCWTFSYIFICRPSHPLHLKSNKKNAESSKT